MFQKMRKNSPASHLCFLSITAALIALSGCASKHNRAQVVKRTEVKETSHQANNQNSNINSSASQNPAQPQPVATATAPAAASTAADRSLVSSIDFEPGRKGLSAEATAELNRVIMEAKQKGEVQQVNVAVWSDSEASASEGKKLPAGQVSLAQQRAKNIEKYMDRMEPAADVHVINMAQKPAAFAHFIQSQDPSVKEKLSAMGMATDESTSEIKGRSSSAVVVIQVR